MKRYFLISLFGSLCLLHSGCIKDQIFKPSDTPRELPPLTHEGLNIFGCYVDEELMMGNRIYVDFGYFRPDLNDSLSMSIELEDKQAKFHLRIDISNKIKGPGKYSLASMYSSGNHPQNYKSVDAVVQNKKDKTIAFHCKTDMYGELNIMTYDVQTQKMSGTFEFDAVFLWSFDSSHKAANFDTVRVRQGRFDYKR